jgi:hypothetical protein
MSGYTEDLLAALNVSDLDLAGFVQKPFRADDLLNAVSAARRELLVACIGRARLLPSWRRLRLGRSLALPIHGTGPRQRASAELATCFS